MFGLNYYYIRSLTLAEHFKLWVISEKVAIKKGKIRKVRT